MIGGLEKLSPPTSVALRSPALQLADQPSMDSLSAYFYPVAVYSLLDGRLRNLPLQHPHQALSDSVEKSQ
jgi:hypothetical protein